METFEDQNRIGEWSKFWFRLTGYIVLGILLGSLFFGYMLIDTGFQHPEGACILDDADAVKTMAYAEACRFALGAFLFYAAFFGTLAALPIALMTEIFLGLHRHALAASK